jgi:lipopolysaccharide export LptBFGC system permease protein LptF
MRSILKYIFLAIIAVGASVMLGMLIWSYHLDRDFYVACAGCSTQEAVARFHQQFWAKFFVSAALILAACLALSVLLPSKTAMKLGLSTVVAGVVGVFLSFTGTNLHGWTGASALTLTATVVCGGVALFFVGGCRLGWTRLRCRKS